MVILADKKHQEEKQRLDEVAIRVISSRKDGLPFKVAIKSPDHKPPHAHIMDLKTGQIELGQFLISKNPPRRPEDIRDYKQGITDEMRQIIFNWAGRPYSKLPEINNWKALYLDWLGNEER